jgi:ankyrin repeat protein
MFETLDAPLDKTVDRRWPLLTYSLYAIGGLLILILEVRKHGFSEPYRLVVPAAMFLLSFTWLVATLGSEVPPTRRQVRFRSITLLFLMMTVDYIGTMFPRIGADPNEILRAAYDGDLEKTRLLLKHNPNLVFVKSKEGFTALHYAASHGYVEIAKLLLAKGADVNATISEGDAPLHRAVWYGHKETAQLLLSNKADVDIRDGIGRTPLYDAAAAGQIEEVRILLAAKADVNARTSRGYTPLSVAASDGHEDIVRLLIDNGVNVNYTDINGHTPLYWARTKKHERVEDLLLRHGALELPCENSEASSR